MSELQSQARSGSAVDMLGIVKDFGTFRAVENVTLQIQPNEFFTLLGPSGCGKTTLLRLMAGFETPTAGSILLGAKDISHLPPNHRPINTVFQNYALFPHMTVAENIAFGLKMLGRPKSEIVATVDEMLRLVRLEGRGDRRVTQLSGGQQQRVALARALAPRPQILLLDEPLSALDLKLRQSMQIELKRLQSETGITFIFVTHDQEEALTMSDRIAVMNAGKVLQVGCSRDIYEHPADRFVAGFIGETNFLEGDLQAVDGGVGTIRLKSGVRVAARLSDAAPRQGTATIVIRPEHIEIAPPDTAGSIPATVTTIVYFGTDTHVHASLADGTAIVVRQQNRRDGNGIPQPNTPIGLILPAGASQVLRD
ncbi:ABC transporter ATP-binding protein [Rhizobium vallis]|uniref:Spermidine/putrescine import ATP-binding protein PotA n=1 Tax=Rhizobium vallis TaxID=634290 RepID=A0A3S0T6U4_9HYPH|nr:ABC transporter ATP-binding protein [Rhizobium vallis]RUM25821.1 ABC transporter ATP-binding protein [Rhizobium vallis]